MEGQIVESNSISHCQTGNDAQNSSVEPEEHVPHSSTSTSETQKVCHTVGEAQFSDDDAHAAFSTPLASPDDYRQAKLIDTLWWKSSDFFAFQQQAHSEIRQMAAYDSSSHSDARRKLYQPSGDELALPQHFETSPVVTDKLEQVQDEDVIDVVSSFAQPLALRTMHRSVSFDNLARLKSQRAEASSASRTTVAGASITSNIGSRIRSQSLTPPVLTESCVRRIFRNNSMDKLKALALSRGKTTTTTVSEVQQHLPLENSVAVDDDLLCVPGPDVELRDAPTPKCSNNNRSFFGILSKAVDRDVLTRVVAWTSALTIAVLLASATTPGVGHSHL